MNRRAFVAGLAAATLAAFPAGATQFVTRQRFKDETIILRAGDYYVSCEFDHCCFSGVAEGFKIDLSVFLDCHFEQKFEFVKPPAFEDNEFSACVFSDERCAAHTS